MIIDFSQEIKAIILYHIYYKRVYKRVLIAKKRKKLAKSSETEEIWIKKIKPE